MTIKDKLFLCAAQELGLLRLNYPFFYGQQSANRQAKPVPAPVPGGLLTPAQLALHIGTSTKYVYEHLRPQCGNPIPNLKIGKFVRFKLEEVERWLATQEH